MTLIDTVKAANTSVKEKIPLEKTVGVFVGGTSGIGEYTAYKFAQYTKNPTVYVIGRNEAAGNAIIDKLKELNSSPDAKYYFMKHDVSLMKECDKLCDVIKSKEDKVNLLFLSSGFLSIKSRDENEEGLDKKFSVNYYGRWRVVSNLMPLVSAAAEKDNQARVVSVLAPGNEGPLQEDDLDLKKKYTMLNFNRHIVEFNSLAVVRFANLYPKVSFTHAHPGIVSTKIDRDLPWWIRAPIKPIFKVFAQSADDSAEKFFYLGYSGSDYKTGSHIVDANLKDLKAPAENKGFLTKELQDKVWDHTEQSFKEALSK